ncbi:MAG: hypothetical protein WBA00_12510 [Rhodococcus sp. (in: high G+C Gram-positive bacteria)]
MKEMTTRGMKNGAFWALGSAPMAAGLTALVWQFPIAIAGTDGRSIGAALAAILTMLMFMTLFSLLAGAVAIALIGAVAGYAARRRSRRVQIAVGCAVGIGSALVVAVADAYWLG